MNGVEFSRVLQNPNVVLLFLLFQLLAFVFVQSVKERVVLLHKREVDFVFFFVFLVIINVFDFFTDFFEAFGQF